MRFFILVPMIVVWLSSAAYAQDNGYYGYETRQDAYQRQQAENYEAQRQNPYGYGAGRQETLGDPTIQPSSRELNDWSRQSRGGYGAERLGD